MSASSPVIAVCSGEPAGIGPDICALLAMRTLPLRLAVLGDPAVLEARAALLGLPLQVAVRDRAAAIEEQRAETLQVLPVDAAAAVVPGRLDPRNTDYVLGILRRAVDLCLRGECAALATAPVQKSVLNQDGITFSGHTEFLAELTGAAQPVMMLTDEKLRVALATTHLPLRSVVDAIDQPLLERILTVIDADLRERFGIAAPRIMVLGLNPHAGESGVLGDEESTIIAPVVARLCTRGFRVFGPVSADTAFTPESLVRCDIVLAMYHDQGLPVIKALGFGEIVNVTLGLPIIRTSVDHGTALPLAGTGQARGDSLLAAVRLADELARRAAGR
jgi:4-hydroxythreonine-4-phosphate dehydrogenase